MRQVLEVISKDLLLEARWLNTLSLLEHIGSRKISKSVCEKHPSLEVLEHFADETRHAYIFKKLASRGHAPTIVNHDENYLCRDEAVSYFQMLDSFMTEWIRGATHQDDTYQNYLLVTCMIERRAMKLYPLYKSITRDDEVRLALQQIILEETNHRYNIETHMADILKQNQVKNFSACTDIEEQLFTGFQSSLKKNLNL